MSVYKVSGSNINLNDIALIPPYDPYPESRLIEIQGLFYPSQSEDISLNFNENKQFRSIQFEIIGETGSLNIVGPITGSYNVLGNRITSGITGSGTPLYCLAIDYTSSANVIVQANTLEKGEFVGFFDSGSDTLLAAGVLGEVIRNQTLTNTDWVTNNKVIAKFSPFRTPTVTRTVTSATPSVSPTPTVTRTVTSATPTASSTPTVTLTVTSATPSSTPSPTVTRTVTSATPSSTPTPTVTRTVTSATPSVSPTPTVTRTVTSATPSSTPSPTVTRTVTSATPSSTPSPTVTRTVTSATPSSTPTPTVTRTVTSATPTPTSTPTITRTITSATPTATVTRTRTITPTPSNSPIASACSSSTYDIEFLFDESGSINGIEYQQMKDAAIATVEKLIAYLSSGSTGFQFGGSSFASAYTDEFDLESVFSTISSSIDNMTQTGGTTNLTDGLYGAYASVTGSSGARSVDKKLIVLTDGSPNSQASSSAAADYVNNDSYDGTHRTEIIAVGIGVTGNTAAFLSSSIASTTSSYLAVADFASLTDFANAIVNLLCAPLPSPTPSPTPSLTRTRTVTPTNTPTRTITRTRTRTVTPTPSTSAPITSKSMGAQFYKSDTAYGFNDCTSACDSTTVLFTAYITKGSGNSGSVIETGDFLYSDASKTIPLINDDYYSYPDLGTEYCVLVTGSLGLVHSKTECSPIVTASPTPSQTVVSPSPTRTRTVSTSTSATCNATFLGYDASSRDSACGASTSTYYLDGAYQAGTYVYTDSSCGIDSAAGFYSNGLSVFEKTSSSSPLSFGTLC